MMYLSGGVQIYHTQGPGSIPSKAKQKERTSYKTQLCLGDSEEGSRKKAFALGWMFSEIG
jgi:hypothetical protein